MTYPQQPQDPNWQQPQQYPPPAQYPISAPPTSGGGYPAYPNPYSPAPFSGPPAQQYVHVTVQTPPSSGMAVASMVLAILGLVTSCCSFGIFSILAVILGHAALGETRDGRKSGRGMAQAGLVMGYVVVIPAILFSAWVVFLGGVGALSGVSDPSVTPS